MGIATWNSKDYDYRSEVDDAEITDDTALNLGPFDDPPDVSEVRFEGAQRWMVDILRQAHLRYFRRRYDQALNLYLWVLEYFDVYLRVHPLNGHPEDEFNWLRDKRYLAFPMMLGDTYAKMGAFEKSAETYITASAYPGADPAITWAMIWNRAAEATVEAGDKLFRANSIAGAKAKYEELFDETSPLFSGPYLNSLHNQVVEIRRGFDEQDPLGEREIDFEGHTPLFLSVVARADARLSQVDRGEDYYGISPDDIPITRFSRLKDVARAFAQTASRANREYLSFLSNAEQQAHSVENLRRAVEVEDQGVRVEIANYNSASAEVRAADEALSSAEVRHRLAREAFDDYRDRGWKIALLEELQAWANSAAGNPRTRLGIRGYESLGLQGGYIDPSDRIYEIASKRARTSFYMRRNELQRQVRVRRAEVELVRKQAASARARLRAANAQIQAARARQTAAQASYLALQNNVTNARLYFELANEVERTARIYLDRAIHVSHVMQRAFNVEFGVEVDEIKGDYGDLRGANAVLAADRLAEDIDYFDYFRVVEIKDKRQNATITLSLVSDFPIEFRRLKSTGEAEFALTLDQLHGRFPGIYNARVKRVMVEFLGYYQNNRPNGSLSSGSSSSYRLYHSISGEFRAITRLHGTETQVLSDFRVAKDSFVLPQTRDQLAMFENVGLDTSWLLSLPLWLNDFRRAELLDVVIHIVFECQHDTLLMAADIASLPQQASAVAPVLMTEILTTDDAMKRLSQGQQITFEIPVEQIPRFYHAPRISRVQAYLQAHEIPEGLTVHLSRAGEDPGPVVAESDGRAFFQDPSDDPFFVGVSPAIEWTLQLSRDDGAALTDEWLSEVVLAFEIDYHLRPQN